MFVLKHLFRDESAEENLRIIITRHGERADLALGPKWSSKQQTPNGHSNRVSYLTPRADYREWNYDPALTVNGENQSTTIGRKLRNLGYKIDYCYSSPAYRSIQTANKILEGQGRKALPINIEPGLFECPSWYGGNRFAFIPPEKIAADGYFNINSSYSPVYDSVDATEEESRYYKRSRTLIDSIVKAHKNLGGTILLSGHAGSIETITAGMLGRRPRPERLQYKAEKVNYCNFVILERDARTKRWLVHTPGSYENPYGAQRSIQSSIPLYRATSQMTRTDKTAAYFARKSLYGDRSYLHRSFLY